jgi:hypothetical protein
MDELQSERVTMLRVYEFEGERREALEGDSSKVVN